MSLGLKCKYQYGFVGENKTPVKQPAYREQAEEELLFFCVQGNVLYCWIILSVKRNNPWELGEVCRFWEAVQRARGRHRIKQAKTLSASIILTHLDPWEAHLQLIRLIDVVQNISAKLGNHKQTGYSTHRRWVVDSPSHPQIIFSFSCGTNIVWLSFVFCPRQKCMQVWNNTRMS